LEYLKQDQIGKVIAAGLSKLYEEKPIKPVTYLAHWLLAYSSGQKKTQKIQISLEEREIHKKNYNDVI
jgi:hypothetical protein